MMRPQQRFLPSRTRFSEFCDNSTYIGLTILLYYRSIFHASDRYVVCLCPLFLDVYSEIPIVDSIVYRSHASRLERVQRVHPILLVNPQQRVIQHSKEHVYKIQCFLARYNSDREVPDSIGLSFGMFCLEADVVWPYLYNSVTSLVSHFLASTFP